MKFNPLHDRVVVKRVEADTQTAGGIIIPDNVAEKPDQGIVVAIGGQHVLGDLTHPSFYLWNAGFVSGPHIGKCWLILTLPCGIFCSSCIHHSNLVSALWVYEYFSSSCRYFCRDYFGMHLRFVCSNQRCLFYFGHSGHGVHHLGCWISLDCFDRWGQWNHKCSSTRYWCISD